MTTPEPVSPAPGTDRSALIEAVHEALQVDAITAAHVALWGEATGWVDTTLNEMLENAVLDSVVQRIAPLLAGLRADLNQARAERDKFADEVDRLNLEIQRHQVGDGYQRGHEHGVQAGLQHAARSASAIPDDAAAQIAQCLSDYWISLRGRRQDADETEHGQAEDVDRLVRSWLAPTTGPAPAAADRVCDCATCWPGSSFMHLCARCGNKRCPGAANHANECTGSNATGQPGSLYEFANTPSPTRCAGCNAADEFWCSCPDGYEPPAAPQAPAEPTELPSSLLTATLTNLAISQAELARRTGISTRHINFVIKGKAGLGVDLANALSEVTGVPADRWLHAEANRLSGFASRKRTAPPDSDGYNSDLTAGFLRPSAPTEEV